MEFQHEEIRGGPDEVAERLQRAGTALRGRNLRRASWLEIAHAMRQQRVARLALPLIKAATTRTDALRILRLVRKLAPPARREGGKARGGKRLKPTVPPVTALALDLDVPGVTDDEPYAGWGWDDGGSPLDYRVWQAWDSLANSSARSTLQDCVPSSLWNALTLLARGELEIEQIEQIEPAVDNDGCNPVPAHEIFGFLREIFCGEKSHYPVVREDVVSRLTAADLNALSTLKVKVRSQELGREEFPLDRQERFMLVVMLAPLWIRSPATWRRLGNSDPVHSLIQHLFVKFPVPPVLHQAWTSTVRGWRDRPLYKPVIWFILLGQGHHLRRIGREFGWNIPRQFIDRFWHVPEGLTVHEGILWAKVMSLGATPSEYRRLIPHDFFSFDPTGNPALFQESLRTGDRYLHQLKFFESSVRWLARYRDELTDPMCVEVLQWAEHQQQLAWRARNPAFSWSGRTPRAAYAAALEHAANQSRHAGALFKWKAHDWDWLALHEAPAWSMRELLNSTELQEEGEALEHCVRSYARLCAAGRTAILSLRIGGLRAVTVEVSVAPMRIVQVKGLANRAPTSQERTLIARWLSYMQLRRSESQTPPLG